MNIGRIYHGSILINDELYICGGLDPNLNSINTCEKYNIKENKWISISSMKESLSKINLVQIDEKTFAVFGGIKNDNTYNSRDERIRIRPNRIRLSYEQEKKIQKLPSFTVGRLKEIE